MASSWFASLTILDPAPVRAQGQGGRDKPKVIRILKRYVARELYRYLPHGESSELFVSAFPSTAAAGLGSPVADPQLEPTFSKTG